MTFPSLTQVAGHAAAAGAAGTWERLSRGQPNPGRFDPVMAAGLPEPACRWLTHAIVPGTPLVRAVIVEMEGHIRLGRWLPFRAVQLHAPPDGYVWAARARLGPLRISGFDRDGPRPDSATAEWTVGARTLQTELRVSPAGELRSVVMPRWGNPNGHAWGEYPCGGILAAEVDFGGIRLPTQIRAGWFFDTGHWAEGEFFRAQITKVTFL